MQKGGGVFGSGGNESSQGVEVRSTKESLDKGPVIKEGEATPFYSLARNGGEPYLVRYDLVGSELSTPPFSGRSILRFVQLTDVQLADTESPARFEYINRFFRDPKFTRLIPGFRAQETLVVALLVSFVEAINSIGASEVTGAGLDLVLTSGDATDNAQENELDAFLSILAGGVVRLKSIPSGYLGVQTQGVGDEFIWHPDPGKTDLYKDLFGHPTIEGLLDKAVSETVSPGLRVPWIGCNGNHELLLQGVGVATQAAKEIALGRFKQIHPGDIPRSDVEEVFVERPEAFLTGGTSIEVAPEPKRQIIDKEHLISAYLKAPGEPKGHGFSPENLRDGTAYFSYEPNDKTRVIVLDTSHLKGAASGVLEKQQAKWLEERLIEVHSSYLGRDGSMKKTDNKDRYVILCSHHPLEAMDNSFAPLDGYLRGPEVQEILGRFPNLICWVAGHVHRNEIAARVSSHNQRWGYWEVVSSAVMDWPSQLRMCEIVDHGDGYISIFTEMLNNPAPLLPDESLNRGSLASIHRLLSANAPAAGIDSKRYGSKVDRNTQLLLRARF